jgi:hypothetical protein
MSDTNLVRAITLDSFRGVAENIEGVHLCDLPPFTTLLVRTVNSLYRIVITDGPEVYVQGGAFFPDPTLAYLEGAGIGEAASESVGLGLACWWRFAREAGGSSPPVSQPSTPSRRRARS